MPRGAALMNRTVKLTAEMMPVFGPGKTVKVKDLNKRLWDHIKKAKLMSGKGPLMTRTIAVSPQLKPIFGAKKTVKPGEMNKLLWDYIKANKLF